MNSWNEGYFTDSTYTYGYYRELSPNFMRWCLLLNGIAAPEITADSCHCELGYGQGISANIHAAATPGKFFGTDFNPAHAAQANELAEASGADAKFFEDSFEEFSKRDDLPQFDSIGLHGIWTWVSAENRQHMLEVARQHLKSGGMLYNSYNCLPGWAMNAPVRELLILHDKYFSQGDTNRRVKSALQFIGEMFDAEPAYVKLAPSVQIYFDGLKKHNPDYIAHEYLNLDWDLMYFADVAELSQSAKLDFAATAIPLEANKNPLPEKPRDFLNKIDNPIVREQLRDYFVNRQFRKDIFVRGVRRLSPADIIEKILSTRYVLTSQIDKIPMKIPTPFGELALSAEIYRPLLDFLASKNCRPKNLHEYLAQNKVDARTVIEVITFLVNGNHVMPCQSDAAISLVKKSCERLNSYICERAKTDQSINFLASPLTGCGVGVNRFQQIFLATYKGGGKSANDLAQAAWKILSRQGQTLVRDGAAIQSPEENLIYMTTLAETFLTQDLPQFKALLIA